MKHPPAHPAFQPSRSASSSWGTRSRAPRALASWGENWVVGISPASLTSFYKGGSSAPLPEGLQPPLWEGRLDGTLGAVAALHSFLVMVS